jgi:VCBS repeat-containing protein
MKKLLLISLVVLMSTLTYAQTVCPVYTVIPIKFYKPVTANLQVERFTSCDPENNTVTWSIVETQTLWKNTGGDIFVNDATAINSSPLTTFTFTLKLLDNGTTNGVPDPKFTNYTITLNEFNDVPVISPQAFNVNENSVNGTVVGAVVATDVNTRQSKTYSIVSGNTGGAFSINASNGNIVVTNSTLLNYETTTSFPLVIKVTDNGTVPLSAQATVTINVKDINEAPVINDQTFGG